MTATAFSTRNVNYNVTADGNFGWTVNYNLAFQNSVFQVALGIKLVGDTANSSLITTWENGIETIWNHEAFFSDGTRLYEVTLDANFVSSGQNQTVTFHNSTGHYDTSNWYAVPQGWGTSYLDEAAAHEFGHMLGNYDEYAGGATHNGYTTTGTLMSDLTVAGFQNYFGSIQWYSQTYSGATLSVVLARDGTAANDTLNGTAGMDGFYGFGGDDRFDGFGGNDYIDGGAGTDTAIFSGNRASYAITSNANGSSTISGPDGTDILVSIEYLQFNDMTISLAASSNHPPAATINDHSLATNQWAQIANWISYSDFEGNPATQYQFWDSGTDYSSGYFWTPSNAHWAANTAITVAASDLANAWVRGGQTAGSETMWVRAFDGTDWSAWDSFTLTTLANHPPVATINDHSLATNRWAQIANWISYSDFEGNPATQYQFWDSGTDYSSGYFWTPSNAHWAANTAITVAASDLANAWVRGGQTAGSETMWVRAFDGTDWSAWDSFTLTTTTAPAPLAPTVAEVTPDFTLTTKIETTPVVTVANVTAAHGQSFAASSLMSAIDADGDAITQYAFWDTGAGGGHFVLNGVAQGTSQEIDVTAAQLSQLSYQSGSGPDMLWVRVNDGLQWTAWSNSFTLTAPVDAPPVQTVANVTLSKGQSAIAASSLFTTSDPEGDTIAKYAFWNAGAGGGHFMLNGVAQGSGQEIDVSAAQLSELTYQSGSGADTLWVRANDGMLCGNWSNAFTVTAPIDHAPVVTASNVTAAHGQSFAAASLFNVSDADGDAITTYAFWDSGTGGGHFVLNGVAQGVSQEIDVGAAQLSQLSYQSGSGTDTLWVRASDGMLWSNWSNGFTVTAPLDTGPVVTATNASIKSFPNQSFAASSLISYSDPFGSPATQYDFWDSGAGGGHFVLNGNALPSNQDNIISAAQLSQLSYVVGTGSDTLWARANDGTVWGAWSKSFTISDPPAVAAGETITLGSAYAGRVDFLGDTGTLKLEHSSSFAGTVAGLCGQDSIDLADIAFGADSTLGYAANADNSGGILSVGDGTHMANIALLGSYMASSFVAASDGHGGTLISEAAQSASQMPVITQPHA